MQNLISMRSVPWIGATRSSGSTRLVAEDCESGVTPAGWTNNSTPTWNYTTAPAPLRGTYSLFLPSASQWTRVSFTGQSTVYFRLTFNMQGALTNFPYICSLRDSAGATQVAIRALSTGGIRVYNGDGTDNGTTAGGTVVIGTTYYLWGSYTKGTGANGLCSLWISTTDTKPGSTVFSTSSHKGTADVARLYIENLANLATCVYDDMIVDTAPIGSGPMP
jgi:hypothetical protein